MRTILFFYKRDKINLPLSCLQTCHPNKRFTGTEFRYGALQKPSKTKALFLLRMLRHSDTINKFSLNNLHYGSHLRGSKQAVKKKKHKIIRPLLYLKRESITTICQNFKMPVYPDKSNRSVQYSRNRVRKQIIPSIKCFLNPQVENSLFKVAELLNREQDFLYSLLKNTLVTYRNFVE